ncbi:MAG TPA: CDGSH iron-sulfur domain-containing protein [Actinomycetota bacterium]|jgi:CDGSH-type Zn-finger protein
MSDVEIHVRPDGSLKVYGKVRLLDVDGAEYPIDVESLRTDTRGHRLKLCRCGASKQQPFCDESHRTIGFASTPRVGDGFEPT